MIMAAWRYLNLADLETRPHAPRPRRHLFGVLVANRFKSRRRLEIENPLLASQCHRVPCRLGSFFRDWPLIMTEILRSDSGSVARGAVDEFGMAGAIKFTRLVKSCGPVVGSVDDRQHCQYRRLVRALRLPS